ncbi:MAG: BamA/TamA family outer membrane protein [Bacteroidota bacterium]|jgi:hypothetical protein
MNKRSAIALIFLCWSFQVVAQSLGTSSDDPKPAKLVLPEWVNHLVNDTGSSAKPRFLFYPTIGFSPETRWEFGASGLVVFHYNNDTTLRLSEISAFGFYTEMKQVGLWMDHAIYGKDNNILALGKIRLQNYPLKYYGVGNNISKHPIAVVPATYYNIRERLVYRLKGNLFTGLELDYQHLSNPTFQWDESVANNNNPIPRGGYGSRNLGVGMGLLWDSRHNILNVREGFLAELAYLHYGNIFSESFPMNTLFLDGRYFHAVKKNQVLALQVLGQFSSGEVPFNQLSMMGGEMMMRGMYLGKYRDKQYLAAQAEYRFLPFGFSKRLGGAVFAGVGSISSTLPTANYKLTGGVGLRYLLFPKKDIFTRLDVGFEKYGYGIYFYIGEAF